MLKPGSAATLLATLCLGTLCLWPGAALRRTTPSGAVVIDEQACTVDGAPEASFKDALAVAWPSDVSIAQFVASAEKAEAMQDAPTPEERKEYKAAMEEYGEASKTMKNAQARLMSAMTKMLQVPAVGSTELTSLLEKKEKDLLIVFYAPWCPHCQTFVLHDGKGSPEGAPLEIFNRNVMASSANMTLSVLRYDISADRNIPAGFEVKHIPTIYMAAADGKKTPFNENHVDSATLVNFIKANSAKTKTISSKVVANATVFF